MAAPRSRLPLFPRFVAVAVLLAGIGAAIMSYRAGRQEEFTRAEAQFTRRAAVRHALTREILGRYEDSLFGFSALFMLDTNVTRSEFTQAATRLEQRIPGAQAFEWVPFIAGENRAAAELDMRRYYPRRNFEFVQFDAHGERSRAAERSFYYPICFIQPLAGNEVALGYDLNTGPTAPFLERARETRRTVVTNQVRLVQEKENKEGVVMIWPVYRVPRPAQLALANAATRTEPTPPAVPDVTTAAGPASPAPPVPEVFFGFLQCVFRVHDLLETVRSTQPDAILDMLFVDMSENDPEKRILYYRPADDAAPRTPVPSEAAFRGALHREHEIPFGQRDWQVLYRPRAGWLASQQTHMPLVRAGGFVLLAALLAGLVQIVGRQTETIRREVDERTRELAQSRRQVATLLHALPGMAFRCSYDERMRVLFVSEGARDLTGWPAEDFTSGVRHLRDLIHPEDVERVRAATRAAVQSQSDFEVEYRIRTRDGGEKWVLSRARGLVEPGQRPLFEGLAIDITAQKNSEAARLALERKLLESQKLESLGLLAGGIAHDFNNLLSTILGNASLVRLQLPAGADSQPQLRAIETASLRAAELCRQMLAYAGKGRFVIEPADLTALTEDLLPLLRISIAHHAALNLHLTRGLPAVMADATQLRQILMNLVLNAADAIGERGGEIVIATGVMRADATLFARCATGAGLPDGDYVFLEVRDTGAGMAPEVLAKIFDPFFTTKFAGRGLGLAAVLGIVRGHNGALAVESTPGRGSVFRLLLPPAADAAPAGKSPEPPGSGRWQHHGKVLVIEDETPVRTIMTAVLKSFGLATREAANGTEGLACFREDPASFDVVLLDLMMPGLNGEQTLASLRIIRPDVRVLLMSGYSEGDILRRLGGAGPLAFLAKPFTREALETKLRALLE